MIRSMTGYGTTVKTIASVSVTAEIRSWNHKALDLQFRLPGTYLFLEPELRSLVAPLAARGKVTVSVTIRGQAEGHEIHINEPLIENVMSSISRIAARLDLPITFSTRDAFSIPGAVEIDERPTSEAGDAIRAAVADAAAVWNTSRLEEGSQIQSALTSELDALADAADSMKSGVKASAEARTARLSARIADIIGELRDGVDEKRLEVELAMMAERADIQEELVRLDAHIMTARKLLGSQDQARDKAAPVGPELGFLLQELLRETNTVSSKSQDMTIIQPALAAKKAIDRMKEQGANVV